MIMKTLPVRCMTYYRVHFGKFFNWLFLVILIGLFCWMIRTISPVQKWRRSSTQENFSIPRLDSPTVQVHLQSNDHYLQRCPFPPPNLKGKMKVIENVTIDEAESRITGVRKGGIWWPSHCQAIWKVAIIVCYRDRYSHLGPFLNHMHEFMQRQELNYSIYIIEQEGTEPYNRAKLLNVGFVEAEKDGPWDCFAFHDIDLLPENDHHLYHCSSQPRHLTVAASNHRYTLWYRTYAGGALLMTANQIKAVNGWSNLFWGWGCEDDDMYNRITKSSMVMWRYPSSIARYTALHHKRQIRNEKRGQILKSNRGKHLQDGLNTLKYIARNITRQPLYTHVLAFIGYNGTRN